MVLCENGQKLSILFGKRGQRNKKVPDTFSHSLSLRSLLADPDLRRRGLAGYIAVKHWGQEGIKAVKPWLTEEAQMARFDAISALLEFGGGRGPADRTRTSQTRDGPSPERMPTVCLEAMMMSSSVAAEGRRKTCHEVPFPGPAQDGILPLFWNEKVPDTFSPPPFLPTPFLPTFTELHLSGLGLQ
jgi:hypothetical protein